MPSSRCFRVTSTVSLLQRVALPPNVTAEYRRYGLYAYSEGRHTEKTRNMQFSGIPVLFIPGQGGSLKQGLYLISVQL